VEPDVLDPKLIFYVLPMIGDAQAQWALQFLLAEHYEMHLFMSD
jgi:hypothetical protein